MAGEVALTRVKLRTLTGFKLPAACACCVIGQADRQVNVHILDKTQLVTVGLQVVLSAALLAAVGMTGAGFEVSESGTKVPVCSRCHWHCKVHEVAAVVAIFCGIAAGAVALVSWNAHLARRGAHRAGFWDLFLPFATAALVVGGVVYLVFAFAFAFPRRQCASRWPPVRCADAGGGVHEFAFTNRVYAREFVRLNADNVVS